ncbi:MAG TPA: PAS domain S-box protein, partial [Pyrinomonadaceae bacterium]
MLINSNVRWEDGEFVHTRCFTRDVTERRRAEAEREMLLEREQVLGGCIWELLPGLVDSAIYEQYRRAVAEQTPVEFEIFYPPLGGWFEVRAYPSKDGLAVYSQDITERKRAEEALRRSEQDLSDFFENGVVGLHWVGPDGTILRANRAELEMLGYSAEEYVGHNITEFHADRAAIADILRRLQAREVLREYPARLRCKDGSLRHVLIDSSVMWEGDRFVHTRCFTRDVTERRRAEEALRASESRLRAMFGQAAVGIVLVDCEGRLLEVNRRFCEILGRPAEELCALTCEDLTHPEDWFCNGAMMREVAEGTREEFAVEKRYARGDGSWVWVRVAVSPLHDAEGCVERMLAVVEDIDARKRAEAEREQLLEREKALRAKAEEANRLKDEFLATVSHELRTPLTAIIGWAQMLEKTPLDSETARHAVGVISRNADQQRQIVEDILDVSRAITGKLKLEHEPVEVSSLVQGALDAVAPSAKAKGIRLSTAFDPVAVVRGDPSRLRQVVWNLLSNAVKFTPAGGEVRVRVERMPSCARIEVSDTGQGIAPEFLPYVFDRFRQADGSTTRQYGGLGLGLAIVRHLVELHGGTVSAYSAGEEEGSTFIVELPLPMEAERAAGAAGVT